MRGKSVFGRMKYMPVATQERKSLCGHGMPGNVPLCVACWIPRWVVCTYPGRVNRLDAAKSLPALFLVPHQSCL